MTSRKKRAKRRPTAELRPTDVDRSNWWDRLSDRAQHGWCIGFLLAVSFGFFAPIHFTDQTLVGGDIVEWRAMAEYMIQYRAEAGEEPLWAPNAFGGMPGYFISPKAMVPQVNTVVGFVREVIWPTSHLIVLFLGTYLLLVYLTRNKLAGVLAAVGFGLTTYLPIILVAGHNSKYVALAYAPWLVLAFAHALRRPGLLSGLLFGVALAANLRAGHIQPTYYVSFLLGIWWLAEGVAAFRRSESRSFLGTTASLAIGSVLGILMVAQPYLSQAEAKDFTIRGAASGGEPGGLEWEYAMNWSQGIGELVTLLIADAFGGAAAYWGPKPFTAGPHYVGGIILMLAGIAIWRLRSRALYAFAIGTLVMILFSLGDNLALVNRPMFELFPLFDALRAPETWLSTAAFTLSVLAGMGLWYVVRKGEAAESEKARDRTVFTAVGAALAVVLVLIVFRSVLFDFQREGEYEQVEQQLLSQQPELSPQDPRVRTAILQHLSQIEAERSDMFMGDAMRTLIFLTLGGILLVLYRRHTVSAPILQAGLALLVLIDLWGVGRRYLNEDRLVPDTPVEARIPTYDFDRFLLERQQEAGGMGHFRVLVYEGANPMTNARPSFHHESLGGYTGAKLRVYQDFIDHVLFEAGRPNDNALDLMNTRYVVAPVALPGLQPVYRDEQTGIMVLENPDALPRAFFAEEIEVVESPEAIWDRLQSASFEPGVTAIVSEPLDVETAPADSGATASASLVSYTPREIVWRVETNARRLLVASEVYYPAGWKAFIDDEEVPIVQVDYVLRGVVVPPGTHEISMRFEPASHRIGVWLSAAATALTYGGVLVLLGLGFARHRKDDQPADNASQQSG